MIIHNELIDDFRTYMFVGGMPEAVDTFLNYKDDKIKAFKMVSKKIREIYDDYLDDMGLYQTSTKSMFRSKLIYESIYKQLNKENKNYKISQVVEGVKNRDVINPFFWLNSSGVILKSFSLKEKVISP